MGITPESASWISDWANWVLVASLIVGVVATYLVVISSNVKEEGLRRDLAGATERTAKLEKETVEAHARLNVETGRLNVEIGRLNKEAAEANASARLAEARAVEAQLELARFKAPRRLTSEQQATLAERLKTFSGTKFAMSVAPGDSVDLAMDIGDTLKSAGWEWINWPVRWSQVVKSRPGRPEMGIDLMRGIETHISDEALAPLATELFVGLTEAGYANKWVVLSAPREGHEKTVIIIIGSKP